MSNTPSRIGFPAASGLSTQRRALEEAMTAAGIGDAKATAKALWDSGLPRGTVWKLQRQFPDLGQVDAEEAADVALGQVIAKVQDRAEIRNLPALFVTIAARAAGKAMRGRKWLTPVDGDDPEIEGVLRDGEARAACEDHVDEDIYRQEVIKRARSYLPRLPASPAHVMEYVLANLEVGRDDLTSEEVGDALGMEPGTVRTNLSRARERLRRLAAEDGFLDAGAVSDILPASIDEDDGGHDENLED